MPYYPPAASDDQTATRRVLKQRDASNNIRGQIELLADYFGSSGVQFTAYRADGTIGALLAMNDEGDIDIYAFDWTGNEIASQLELEQRGRRLTFGSGSYEREIGTGSQNPNTYTETPDTWHVEMTGVATSGHYTLKRGASELSSGSIAFNANHTAIETYFSDNGLTVNVTGDATSFDVEMPANVTSGFSLGTSTLNVGTITIAATVIGDHLSVISANAGSLYSRNSAGVGAMWVKVAEDGGGNDWVPVVAGAQFTAIADANIGTVVAQFNTLLADLRARGDLAT